MSFVSIIVVFSSIWWILFYIALPIGIKISAKTEEGHADSAPKNPNIVIKAIIVTILAVLISWILVALVEGGHLSFLLSDLRH